MNQPSQAVAETQSAARSVIVRDGFTGQIRGEGIFHAFGLDYEESSDAIMTYSAAIVEWPDGQTELVPLRLVRFITPTPVATAVDIEIAKAFRSMAKELRPSKESREETPHDISQVFLSGVCYAANELLGKAEQLERGQ
jgi:hypothetical protein